MTRARRSNDWGFPRWRSYGADQAAIRVKLCDREGCDQPGTCPAPKAPESPERWYFCADHAAEYNRNWNYFEGLSEAEAARRAEDAERTARGYRQSAHYQWAGPETEGRSRDEMRALSVLGLESDVDFATIRTRWRTLAKSNHPDTNPGDKEAADRFRTAQEAFDVLRTAEERRSSQEKSPERG